MTMMTEPRPRLLVVDDEVSNIELIAEIFPDYNVLFATHGKRALEMAASENPDVILLDIMMPDIDGYEVCRRLKLEKKTRPIPVIFISVLGDVAAETLGLELGAIDYISKPFSPAIVKMRVINQIELKRTREKLTQMSLTDALTKLANRRYFDKVLVQEYARHIRSGGDLSLILLDIDHFKKFNDTHGHICGDNCLQQVAGMLGGMIRATDFVARYGGEEFVCILPETNYEGAQAIAEKIRTTIAGLTIVQDGFDIVDQVTVSLGVVTGSCTPSRSPLMFVAKADELLYKAKSAGRNSFISATISSEA